MIGTECIIEGLKGGESGRRRPGSRILAINILITGIGIKVPSGDVSPSRLPQSRYTHFLPSFAFSPPSGKG